MDDFRLDASILSSSPGRLSWTLSSGSSPLSDEVYLVLDDPVKLELPPDFRDDETSSKDMQGDCNLILDPSPVVPPPTSPPSAVLLNVSIVHHGSYNVPSLYFLASVGSRTATTREVLACMGALEGRGPVKEDAVGIEYHPCTGSTAFFLHQCMTSEMLSAPGGASPGAYESDLVRFMSMALPVVGVHFGMDDYKEAVSLLRMRRTRLVLHFDVNETIM